MTNMTNIIYRILISPGYDNFYISADAINLYNLKKNIQEPLIYVDKMIDKNDPIRKDPLFYDVIRELGVIKTFAMDPLSKTINYYPVCMAEFYTSSPPSIIPYDSWFQPIIHEYDGMESIRGMYMLSPQIDYMKKIQENQDGLSNEEKCLKYEEIISLQCPKIEFRTGIQLYDVFDWIQKPPIKN